MRITFYCLCLGSGSGYTMQERNFIKATSEWLLHLPETDLMPFISDEITFLVLHYLSHWIQYYSPVTECCVIRWQRRNEYKGVIAPYNNLLLTATIILPCCCSHSLVVTRLSVTEDNNEFAGVIQNSRGDDDGSPEKKAPCHMLALIASTHYRCYGGT